MIKTNQILSVGLSLSIGKIWEKLWTNQQPSQKRYVKCAFTKWESTESTSFKRWETLRTRLCGNKITWTETFVRSKKFAKWKTTLNRGTLACYENFPIKTHLKKKNMQSFLCDTVTLLPPDSVASGVYTAFPQITQKILITNTCHYDWNQSL